MSTTFPSGTKPSDTLDVSATPAVPMSRLLRVELRKMWDTRAGMWLLIAIGAITAIVMTIFVLTASEVDRTFFNMLGVTIIPQAFLLPVLGILLVTQEWGQRTGMVTFTLEPHRGKVLWAKVAAAVLFGLAAMLVAMLLAGLGAVLFGGPDAWGGFGVDDFAKIALLQVSGVVQGLVFGLLFLNSAAAIVTSFVLPIAFNVLSSLWSAMKDIAPWVDLGTSQPVLYSGDHVTGAEWAHIATGSLLWIIVPFALGMWRVLRAEVK